MLQPNSMTIVSTIHFTVANAARSCIRVRDAVHFGRFARAHSTALPRLIEADEDNQIDVLQMVESNSKQSMSEVVCISLRFLSHSSSAQKN